MAWPVILVHTFILNRFPCPVLAYSLTLSAICSYQKALTYEAELLMDLKSRESLINHRLIKSKTLKRRIFLNPNIKINFFVFCPILLKEFSIKSVSLHIGHSKQIYLVFYMCVTWSSWKPHYFSRIFCFILWVVAWCLSFQ